MKKRWYDVDPTVSLAVSLIRNSNKTVQNRCAKHIIKSAENNIHIENTFLDIAKYFKRWYDEDKELSTAMEFLQAMPDDLRKKIAVEIIDIIQLAEIE